MGERIFLDTAFVLALLNRRDQYHLKAKSLLARLQAASEIWLSEAILIEIGDGLAAVNRQGASDFIRNCYTTPNMKVVTIGTSLLRRASVLYQSRQDKQWGLTDCISFVIMKENHLCLAMTTDKHFHQAGFEAMMLS